MWPPRKSPFLLWLRKMDLLEPQLQHQKRDGDSRKWSKEAGCINPKVVILCLIVATLMWIGLIMAMMHHGLR